MTDKQWTFSGTKMRQKSMRAAIRRVVAPHHVEFRSRQMEYAHDYVEKTMRNWVVGEAGMAWDGKGPMPLLWRSSISFHWYPKDAADLKSHALLLKAALDAMK